MPKKLTYEFVKESFNTEDYKLLSKEYINSHSKLDYICNKGHKHSMAWLNWVKGINCPKCSNNGTSNFEKEVKQFVVENKQEIIENDRSTIKGDKGRFLELDILLTCKTKAIECSGVYWHSKPEVKKNDIIKQTKCKELGINLLTITDKEWYKNNNKIKNKILNFLED